MKDVFFALFIMFFYLFLVFGLIGANCKSDEKEKNILSRLCALSWFLSVICFILMIVYFFLE
jgi:hypothetical protein